ncbi:MAG: sugar kinase [candidate division FCPU426 bacterium]
MIISRAPVRLSLGGGGTDLPSYYRQHGGFLVAAAIDKYIYIMADKRFQPSIRLSYSKTEIVDRVDEIQHPLFREGLRYAGVERQIELISLAEVPANCGLGTSSTFAVALLNALFEFRRQRVPRQELAEAACRLEMEILKEPIGKQDQYVAAFGGLNAYWFDPDGTVRVEPVAIRPENLRELQNNLLLFYLNRERDARTVLADQDRKSRTGDAPTLERLHRIKEIGLATKKLLEDGSRLDAFGELMHEHWLTKRGLSDKISDSFIDEAYDTARRHGALGGKVVGAGGGGFLLLYCPKEKSKLVGALQPLGLEPMWFGFAAEGARVGFYS